MTTPTTDWDGGRESRTISTVAIMAIRSITTTGPTASCPAWPSTEAARPAAESSMPRMPGPRNTAGRVFWAEWGKRAVRAFQLEPAGATFKVQNVIEFVEPGDVEDFRPLDLALSHDGKTLYIADWSYRRLGQQE